MGDVSRDEAVQATIAGEMFVYSNIILSLAANATNYSSFRTGFFPVLVERRSYGASANSITVRLYEGVASTGGTLIVGTNRDRTPGGLLMPEPQTVRTSVTPGTLNTPLFTLNLVDTNTVDAAFGDPNTDKIRLAAQTDYVLGLTNNDGQPRDLSWSFLVRRSPR